MSQQTIDTSTATDTLAAGFTKVNDNFTEVYASIVQTGMMIDYFGTTAPSGWVLARGGTIGNGVTSEKNLFILLYNALSNTEAPVSGGRTGNALNDFNANKTITLPDLRGKVSVGMQSSGTFDVLGESIGSETHTLVEGELPIVAGHTHIIGEQAEVQAGTDYSIPFNPTGGLASIVSQSSGGFGSGTAHNNIQPSFVVNKIIKL